MDDIRREIEQLTVPKKGANKSDSAKAGSPGTSEALLMATLEFSTL